MTHSKTWFGVSPGGLVYFSGQEDDVPEMNHVSLKAEHKAGEIFLMWFVQLGNGGVGKSGQTRLALVTKPTL